MKYFLSLLTLLLFTQPAFASEEAVRVFTQFMNMVQEGELKEAINEYGIDERSNNPLQNPLSKISVPGDRA